MYSPYPYERLPKLTRAQIHALSQLHSLVSDAAAAEALARAGALLGTTLACDFGPPGPSARAAGPGAVWAELEPAIASPNDTVWLELPIGLCEYLVDRALGGDSLLDPTPTGANLDELSLGALAYLLARIAAALDAGLTLRSIGTEPPPAFGDAFVSCAAVVRNSEARASFRVHVAAHLLRDARAARPRSRSFAALPLSLWAEGGWARLELATLRSLAPGDVIVLEQSRLDATGRGSALVRIEGSAAAVQCAALCDRLEVESIACTSEPAMTAGRRIAADHDANDANDASAASGSNDATLARDAPIELALELARFQLTLGELERLQPGDVLATGRRIGERVTLRAAGRAIAEGELVDIEGELGVRLTRLLEL